MPKAKEAKEPQPSILYDAGQPQNIPIEIEQGNRKFRLVHPTEPLTDDRYYQFVREAEAVVKRTKTVSTDLYIPKQSLWSDLVHECPTGMKSMANWKEKVHQSDQVAVITALLHTEFYDPEIDESEEILYDPDESISVPFRAMQSGALLELSLSFRPETKAEMNEFLAIESNSQSTNAIASAVKRVKAERLAELGRELLQDREGYADGSEVPAWHLAPATEAYFSRELGRMGKSLAP